ncbi:hypothetical protein ACLGDI_05825 [Helicobacter pylori]
MVLYFRDRNLFCLDWFELSQEEIQKAREDLDNCNGLLQLDYSLKNLQRLRNLKKKKTKTIKSA